MAWTAQIESKNFAKGVLQVGVVFTDGTETFSQSFTVENLESLKSQIKSQIDRLTSLSNLYANITPGDIPPAISPTQAELDKQQFLNDYSRWVSVKRAIDIGILTGNEAPVVSLLNKVKAGFKPAYLDLI